MWNQQKEGVAQKKLQDERNELSWTLSLIIVTVRVILITSCGPRCFHSVSQAMILIWIQCPTLFGMKDQK
jgi:hypothetical protein